MTPPLRDKKGRFVSPTRRARSPARKVKSSRKTSPSRSRSRSPTRKAKSSRKTSPSRSRSRSPSKISKYTRQLLSRTPSRHR